MVKHKHLLFTLPFLEEIKFHLYQGVQATQNGYITVNFTLI